MNDRPSHRVPLARSYSNAKPGGAYPLLAPTGGSLGREYTRVLLPAEGSLWTTTGEVPGTRVVHGR